MPLISAEVHNFKALRGSRRYDLPEGLIGLNGPNGIGKSTLVNAIAWAFYGPDVLKTAKADVVTWGAKDGKVIVTFELDGHQYRCERWQNASGTSGGAALWRDDEEKPVSDGLAPVTEEMGRLLGVDHVGFVISVFARQDEINGLAELQSSKRMQTVLRLLGIDNVTAAIETVRKRSREDRKHLDLLRSNLRDMEALDAELNDAYASQSMAEEIINATEEHMEALRIDIDALKLKREQLEPRREAYAKYLNQVSSAKQAVMFAEHAVNQEKRAIERPLPPQPTEPTLQEVPSYLSDEELRIEYDELGIVRSEAEAIRSNIVRLQHEVSGLDNPVCPTCQRPYDNADEIRRTRERLEYQIDEQTHAFREINERGKRMKTEYEQKYVETQAARRIEKQNEQAMDAFRADVRTHALIVAQREEAQGKLAAAEQRLVEAQGTLADLEKSPVEDPDPKFRSLLKEQESAQEQLSKVSVDWSRAKSESDQAARDLSRLLQERAEAKGKVQEVEELESTVVAYETAASELAKMKEQLISRVIPQLTDTSATLLAEMTAGKYTEIDLTSDYEIRFRNDQGDWKAFENLSGGEQRVFALALRLAISELRSNRLGVLFLDEVFESLDTETGRVEQVWGAIENLMGRYHQAILVTHVESLKERAPTTIRVGS